MTNKNMFQSISDDQLSAKSF